MFEKPHKTFYFVALENYFAKVRQLIIDKTSFFLYILLKMEIYYEKLLVNSAMADSNILLI